ncbi:hypothetical protein J4401_05035 [Candidatus Woesearchaeota archaeon]|nr:hypothetical protein [Candidatus Woesearchaeota archaeon]
MILDNLKSRKPNILEYTLLAMGIATVAIGYYFVHSVTLRYGFGSFESSMSLLAWFGIVILAVIAAISESSKEELKVIINQQHEEMRLLREDLRRKS